MNYIRSVVMNHLQTTTARERVAALCIYFNHKEAASQTAVHLLSSLLRQVVERCSDVSKVITDFRRVHNTTRPTFDQFKSAFVTEIEPYEKILLLLMPWMNVPAKKFKECCSKLSKVQLLISWSPPDIQSRLKTSSARWITLIFELKIVTSKNTLNHGLPMRAG